MNDAFKEGPSLAFTDLAPEEGNLSQESIAQQIKWAKGAERQPWGSRRVERIEQSRGQVISPDRALLCSKETHGAFQESTDFHSHPDANGIRTQSTPQHPYFLG